MTTNDQTISTLNELIKTLRDGENGFKTAAEGVSDPQLRSLFLEYSSQRSTYAAELQQLVRQLGASPQQSGSTAAALHRGWINIKQAVTGNDDAAVLAECERGEDSAVEEYQKALGQTHPQQVTDTLQRQYNGVKQAYDKVRNLRDLKREAGSTSTSTR